MTNMERNQGVIRKLVQIAARKTAPIKAKPYELVKDDERYAKTLETDGVIVGKPGSWLCVGIVGEPWWQTEQAIRKTYDEGPIDSNGWTMWTAKRPAPIVNCWKAVEATRIFTKWGDPTPEQDVFTQNVKGGDWICNRPDDPDDFWCVDGALFDATYMIEEA